MVQRWYDADPRKWHNGEKRKPLSCIGSWVVCIFENRSARKGRWGSNPSLSAFRYFEPFDQRVEEAAKALAPMQTQKRSGDSHGDSPYILKGILRSKQGNHPMTGCKSGPKRYRHRYYRTSRAIHVPMTDSSLKTLIPAEPLELAVMDV